MDRSRSIRVAGVLAFIGLAIVPVLLLIAATGVAFGPILGPIYAMAGCLASGSVAFAIGRWLGQHRVEHLGGERVKRITGTLKRNRTLAATETSYSGRAGDDRPRDRPGQFRLSIDERAAQAVAGDGRDRPLIVSIR